MEEDKKRQMIKLQVHPSLEDDDCDYANIVDKNFNIIFSIRVPPFFEAQANLTQKEKME